jgi:predicted nucleotidyltransferase
MSKQRTTVSSRDVRPQPLTSEADGAAEAGARTLDEIVRRVVEVAEPERIILFGSAARGESRPDSDIDLLVVKEGAHRRKLSQAIYRRLLGIGRSVDVVVVTPDDIERYRDAVGLVIRPALEEGRTIYAA